MYVCLPFSPIQCIYIHTLMRTTISVVCLLTLQPYPVYIYTHLDEDNHQRCMSAYPSALSNVYIHTLMRTTISVVCLLTLQPYPVYIYTHLDEDNHQRCMSAYPSALSSVYIHLDEDNHQHYVCLPFSPIQCIYTHLDEDNHQRCMSAYPSALSSVYIYILTLMRTTISVVCLLTLQPYPVYIYTP